MPFTQKPKKMEEKRDRFELLTALYDAALKGDVSSLKDLEQQEKSILDRCSIEKSGHFTGSPLHVAVNLGHLEFTKEILLRKPQLTEEVDHIQRSTPLHLAAATKLDPSAQPGNSSAANRQLEIVKALIEANDTMCLARNKDGWNPIHVAAIKGEPYVLNELLQAQPQAARELTSGGETVLHLCVKYKKTETLKSLVEAMDDVELLNAKDPLGNTVLHLAVATRQLLTVRFLAGKNNMEKDAINTNGLTAMDMCLERKKDPCSDEENDIKRCLERAGAAGAEAPQTKSRTWLENKRNALMVVASLISTMAFQTGINPPGGVWQDDELPADPNGKRQEVHFAGDSIMANRYPWRYTIILCSSTVALVSSLSVILLLISGIPYNRVFVIILMLIMWIAISATALTYVSSVTFISPYEGYSPGGRLHEAYLYDPAVRAAPIGGVIAWGIVMLFLLLVHLTRFIVKIKKLIHCMTKKDLLRPDLVSA